MVYLFYAVLVECRFSSKKLAKTPKISFIRSWPHEFYKLQKWIQGTKSEWELRCNNSRTNFQPFRNSWLVHVLKLQVSFIFRSIHSQADPDLRELLARFRRPPSTLLLFSLQYATGSGLPFRIHSPRRRRSTCLYLGLWRALYLSPLQSTMQYFTSSARKLFVLCRLDDLRFLPLLSVI